MTTRLAALPVCTPAQILQLQIPVDVTTINCRPPTLVPQTEGTRITQELSSSQDFLKQPIVSAYTLQQNQDNTASKPYYESASKAPRVYQALQKAPFALACIALISTVAIYYIATTRRRGQRRIAWVFLETGVLLVLSKIISGVIADKANDHLLRSTKNADLRAAGTSLIHSVQSHVAQINLYFGVIFLTIALVLYVRLYQNREGKGVSKAKPEPATDPEVVDDDEDENIPPLSHMDVSEIQSAPELPASRPPIKAANQAPKLKKPRPPKRPLIQ